MLLISANMPRRRLAPGIPRINPRNDLAYGLTGAYIPGLGSGSIFDLSGKGVSPTCGTSLAFVNTQEGRALDTSAQGAGQGCNGIATSAQQPTKTASCFWRGVLLGTPTTNEYLFGVTLGDGNTSPFAACVLTYANNGQISGGTNVGGTTLHSVAATVSANAVLDAALTVDMTANSIMSIYANGALASNDATIGSTTIGYGTNPQLTIGGTSNAAQNACNARHLVGYTWNRALSATEVAALHDNPYQLFIFPQDNLLQTVRGNRHFTQVMLPTVKASPTLVENPFRSGTMLSGAVSGVPSLVKLAQKPEMVSANALASMAKTVQAMRTSTMQTVPLLVRTARIIRTATANALATLAAVKFRSFVTLSAVANALATIKPLYGHALQNAVSILPSLSHPSITKIVAGTAQGVASMGRRLIKLAVASPALISISSFLRTIAATRSGSSGSASALSTISQRIFSASAGTVAAIARKTLKILSGSSQQVGTFVRVISRALSGSAQAIGALIKTKIVALVRSVAASAIISRVIGIVRSVQAAAAPVLIRVSFHALTSTVLASPTLGRFLTRSLTALSGTAVALQKFLAHPLSSSSMAAAVLIKVAGKPFAATVGTMAIAGRRFLTALSGTAAAAGSMTRMLRRTIAAAGGGLGALVTSVIYDVKRRISIGNETLSVSTVTNEFFGVGSSLGVPATQLPYNQPPPSTAPSVQMPGRSIFIGQGNDPIPAGSTPTWAFQLLDENKNPIGVTALASLTLTISDPVSLSIVNSVSDKNILNADRGTVDAQGNVTIVLQGGDTALLNSTDQMEERSLIAIWTYNGGTRTGKHQADFQIQALSGS